MANLYCFLPRGIVQPKSFYIFPLYASLSIVIAQICNNKSFLCLYFEIGANRSHFVHYKSFIIWSAIQVFYRKFSLEFRMNVVNLLCILDAYS